MGKIVIVGSGISGLTVAHALEKTGHEVLVLEQTRHAGGCIRSERIGGFLMEHGPNIMVGPATTAEDLIMELGLNNQRVYRGESVRHRYLVRNGRPRALPIAPLRFVASNFFSLSARLRLLREPFVPARDGDESIADFTRRRFGEELLDYVIDPLVGGLYAGDPERLSVEAVFPHLKRLEREAGSIIGGIVKARRRRGAPGPYAPMNRALFSFRDGLETLAGALAGRLGSRLRLGCRVENVVPRGGAFRVTARHAHERLNIDVDAVVLALPAHAAAGLVAPLDANAGDMLAGVPHPPLAVVFLGYRRKDVAHPLDGLGVLAPTVERRRVLGMLFSSTLSPGRAPDGHVALTAFVGGQRQPELTRLNERELIDLVQGEARELLGADGAAVCARVRCWPHGLPQPAPGHAQRLVTVHGLEAAYPGLFVTGNYLSGISTTACIAQAMATGENVVRFLSRRHSARLRSRGNSSACLPNYSPAGEAVTFG